MKTPFLLFATVLFISSCKLFQPSVMLKTPKDYPFTQQPDSVLLEYKISKNDLLQFRLFSNDGFQLIDVTIQQTITNSQRSIKYLVEVDGKVKLPTIGFTPLEGLTVREAERFLEKKYSEFYNDPFVMLGVLNRRVIVFPGSEGQASVIPLANENTTLIEALANAGGITNTGKAHKIKLIRGSDSSSPEVYQIDLSTIEGINQSHIILQANDIIYVDPVFKITKEVLAEIVPIISLITSALLIYSSIRAFTPN